MEDGRIIPRGRRRRDRKDIVHMRTRAPQHNIPFRIISPYKTVPIEDTQ